MADRLGKEVGHGDVPDLIALHIGLGGDGVQKYHLVQHTLLDAADGGAGEHAVGRTGRDILRAANLHQGLGRVAQGAAGVEVP